MCTTTIKKAQDARAQKALSARINYNGRIMTRQQWLETLKEEGYIPAMGQKPRIEYNRTKYNRMSDWKEQEEYMRKCEEMLPDPRAKHTTENSFYSLSVTEHNYFSSLFQEDETGPEYATEDQLNHLFGLTK